MIESKTSRAVRIAVIGAGVIGRRHIRIVVDEPEAILTSIVDPSPEAAKYAASLNVAHFDSAEAMLEADPPDAAIIATPNVTHTPIGCTCADQGVHILVEKPIAESVQAAKILVREAQCNQVHLLVGHHRRYHPFVRRGRELVQRGDLGRITAVNVVWAVRKPADYYSMAWRTRQGGGPILINTIHDIDNLRYVVGEIEEIQAIASNSAREFQVEDSAVFLLRFANGAIGSVMVTDVSPSPWNWETCSGESPNIPHIQRNCYTVFGTDASLGFPNIELWRHDGEGWQDPLRSERERMRKINPIAEQLRHFISVIRGETSPIITGEDATKTLAATLAVSQAADGGRSVLLKER